MNFLAPLFLLGALAIAGPVIFHLIRRTTKDRQRFGSLMFLEPTPPRLTKRSRIDHWLLLLLRAGALALLALAFARPFFRTPVLAGESGATGNRTVILVDASASMRRDRLWNQCQDRALKSLAAAGNEGDVAVVSFDRSANTLLTFDDWHRAAPDARLGLVRDRLESVSPSWAGTNVASALMAAAELLAESAGSAAARREIVLITDSQEGSRLESLQGYEWPKNVSVRIETIAPKQPGNAGLQLAVDARTEVSDEIPAVRLRVSNSVDAVTERFQVGWQTESGGYAGTAQDVYVPPGQNRIVTLPWPSEGPKSGRVLLKGDSEDFDNVIAVTPPPSVTVPVIHSGEEMAPRSPLYFLEKAMPAGRTLTASVVHHAASVVPIAEMIKSAPLWIITAPVDGAVAAAVGNYVASGGTAFVMTAVPEMATTVQSITGTTPLSLTTVKPATYALLGTIDFTHPLFSAFADPRFSDFTKIRFWNYCRIDVASLTNAKVVAKFDSGDPALIEVPRANGRVFILAASWRPESSQLALSSKFPSLLASLLATTGSGAAVPSQFIAGEPVPLLALAPPSGTSGLADSGAAIQITAPDGKTTTAGPGAFTFTAPGIHRITTSAGHRDIAVNLDPPESRTAPVSIEEFEKLGAPVAIGSDATATPPVSESIAAATEAEGRQKLWRWLLAGVFAVLFIETLLGNRTARTYSATEGGTPV